MKRMSSGRLLLSQTRKDRRRECTWPSRSLDYICRCCKCLESSSFRILGRKAFACRQELRCCNGKCCIHRWKMTRARHRSCPRDNQLQPRSSTPAKQPTTPNTSSSPFAPMPNREINLNSKCVTNVFSGAGFIQRILY